MIQLNILICGAGIAGNALAFWLSKMGNNVTVIRTVPMSSHHRSTNRHMVCLTDFVGKDGKVNPAFSIGRINGIGGNMIGLAPKLSQAQRPRP